MAGFRVVASSARALGITVYWSVSMRCFAGLMTPESGAYLAGCLAQTDSEALQDFFLNLAVLAISQVHWPSNETHCLFVTKIHDGNEKLEDFTMIFMERIVHDLNQNL